jgi:hypothetical protein
MSVAVTYTAYEDMLQYSKILKRLHEQKGSYSIMTSTCQFGGSEAIPLLCIEALSTE